ncbi:HDOD domain-containing protein [Chromatium okenii]|nr:HDOD domain-containing protein [Chromatium okenii]
MNIIMWLKNWIHSFFHYKHRRLPTAQFKKIDYPFGKEPAKHSAVNVDCLDSSWCPLMLERDYIAWLLDVEFLTSQPLSNSETEALTIFEHMVTSRKTMAQMLPRLPAIIPQLMRSLKDDNISSAQLAQQIARDPVLVGEVIGLANTPYYRRSHKITSIEQAVLLLGQNGLRQLVSRVAFYPILNINSRTMTRLNGARLWQQSEHCALICRKIAELEKTDSFAAYLAGLVSNVGLLAGLRIMDELFTTKATSLSHSWAFYQVFITLAKRLSYSIVTEWGFPKAVTQALFEQTDNHLLTMQTLLGQILTAGDRYSKLYILNIHQRMPKTTDAQDIINHPCYRQFCNDTY